MCGDELTQTAARAVLLYTGADGPLYAFSLFLPSIINQLGERPLGRTAIEH